ncbi:hypothetical protein WJX72_008708 [[Myrmecia] bisecta]|uniref:Uncharacterized protein n=1 Tax=[Myrmecia] bisecta TaxID=41462 RepID=A0AAW1Q462_9CHLO
MGQRCLYDILQLVPDADEQEIKSAYRREARIWHPDKNQDRVEEAGERFKEIQNAYEILIDPRERAWYDTHREAILRAGGSYQHGTSGFGGGQRPVDEVDLFPYFSTTCYSGYGDDLKGFYAVYNALFIKLAKQEVAARKRAGDPASMDEMPLFGTSAADTSSVSHFYSFWLHFSSSKEFAWADEHNPASAPNRKVRRLMEEDNKKKRKASKREYVENVRELVQFVRKRDKRVAAFQAQEAQRRLEKEQREEARRATDKAERIARARKLEEAAWIRQSEGSQSDTDDEEGDATSARTHLLCVVCNKLFKSEKAIQNHERSKKHRDKLAALRAVLQKEAELVASPQDNCGPGSQLGDQRKDSPARPSAQAAAAVEATESSAHELLSSDAASECNQPSHAGSSSSSDDAGSDDDPDAAFVTAMLRSQSAACSPPADEPGTAATPAASGRASRSAGSKRAARRAARSGQDADNKLSSCSICNKQFDSRNQLFAHLAATGHTRVSHASGPDCAAP